MGKRTAAVILASGVGSRFGGQVKKQYVQIGGISAVARSVIAFDRADTVDEIVLVGEAEELRCALDGVHVSKTVTFAAGGSTRQESSMLGFNAVSAKSDYVAIHDAARCLVTPEIIDMTVRAAWKYRAAAAAHKVSDTVKLADSRGFIDKTVDRDLVWLVKTPQVFLTDMYRAAAYMAKKDNVSVTDDCMMCERLGFKVKLVECGEDNIKLTVASDLLRAEQILRSREEEAFKK